MSGDVLVQRAQGAPAPLKRSDCCSLQFMIEVKTCKIINGMLPFSHMNPDHVCPRCREWENRTYIRGIGG